MSATEYGPEECAKEFFSSPNKLTWEAIQNGDLPAAALEELKPWVDRLLAMKSPVILPFATSEGTIWYAAAADSRTFRRCRERILAFIGPTYSNYRGQPTLMDPSAPQEKPLGRLFGDRVIRLRVDKRHAKTVRERLRSLRMLLDQSPIRDDVLPRPPGRVLSDFDEALRRGEWDHADSCIEECERRGLLDSRNLLFLRIRLDEGRERWQGILDEAQRHHIAVSRHIPRNTARAILRACYYSYIESYRQAKDPKGALSKFTSAVPPEFLPLLKAQAAYRSHETDALFFLRAADEASSDSALEHVREAAGPRVAELDWLRELTAGGESGAEATVAGGESQELRPTETDPMAAARSALDRYAFDEAWDILRGAAPSPEVAGLIVTCAQDIGTLEAARGALDSVNALSPEERERLQSRNSLRLGIHALEELAAPPAPESQADQSARVPASWAEWWEVLRDSPRWRDAVDVAKIGALEWEPSEYADPQSLDRIEAAVASLPEDASQAVISCLPYVLSAIDEAEEIDRIGPLLESVLTILLLDDAPGGLFFGTLADLTHLVLRVGITSNQYAQIMRELCDAVRRQAAPTNFDGVLELVDALVLRPSPQPAERSLVVSAAVDAFVRHRDRVSSLQMALLRQVCRESGVEVPTSLQEATSPTGSVEDAALAVLRGKQVAIYSLNEAATSRSAEVIQGLEPDVDIRLFHDKVGGNAALRRAAQTADVFVVVTAAAKHAATEFIDSARPKEMVTLRPKGKGSASVLRSIQEFVDAS